MKPIKDSPLFIIHIGIGKTYSILERLYVVNTKNEPPSFQSRVFNLTGWSDKLNNLGIYPDEYNIPFTGLIEIVDGRIVAIETNQE